MQRVNDNATYLLRELDGTMLRISMVGKCIKVFQRKDRRFHPNDLNSFLTPQRKEKDIQNMDEV